MAMTQMTEFKYHTSLQFILSICVIEIPDSEFLLYRTYCHKIYKVSSCAELHNLHILLARVPNFLSFSPKISRCNCYFVLTVNCIQCKELKSQTRTPRNF